MKSVHEFGKDFIGKHPSVRGQAKRLRAHFDQSGIQQMINIASKSGPQVKAKSFLKRIEFNSTHEPQVPGRELPPDCSASLRSWRETMAMPIQFHKFDIPADTPFISPAFPVQIRIGPAAKSQK